MVVFLANPHVPMIDNPNPYDLLSEAVCAALPPGMSPRDIAIVPPSPFKTVLNFRDVGATMNILRENASVLPAPGRLLKNFRLAHRTQCSSGTEAISQRKSRFLESALM